MTTEAESFSRVLTRYITARFGGLTYQDLSTQDGIFKTLIEEFGSLEAEEDQQREEDLVQTKSDQLSADAEWSSQEAKLVIDEERELGKVSRTVYAGYIKAIRSPTALFLYLLLLIIQQVAYVASTLFLGWWSAQSIPHFERSDYMAIYASMLCEGNETGTDTLGLGAATAFALVRSSPVLGDAYTLQCGSSVNRVYMGIRASRSLFAKAWHRVMRSPTTWHDRTPVSSLT